MSSYNLASAKTLLRKEFIEHKTAFLYVPGILMGLLFLAFFVAVWRNGAQLGMLGNVIAHGEGFDLFAMLYSGSLAVWLGYLTLMLFFYFAASFHVDRKNNSLLFWKSLPVSDLEIMATKTLAGLTVFPAIIMFWAFLGAIIGYISLNTVGAFSPVISSINSGTSFWAFINVQVSAMVFIITSLLWYLPLFAFAGLLGVLLRNWAVPAFILIVAMISALESILTFSMLSRQGVFEQMIEDRLSAPFEIIRSMLNQPGSRVGPDTFEIVSMAEFIPGFLSQIDWVQMSLGWAIAAIFIYVASEYRRRRIES
ncbi:MAG: hypothetical protein L3J21_00670 [Devosiaceae bacterium]|nr:hypothetical protein [Devosiaceae bacterium]